MPDQVQVRLYEELNDYLPPGRQKRRFSFQLKGIGKVQELLAGLGVPVDQVELVLVNGKSVDFSHSLEDGDFVSVYPVFESIDVKSLVRVRGLTLRRVRFLVGSELPDLARSLRSLGLDVLDCGCRPQDEIIRIVKEERRILLTANRPQAGCADLARVYSVRSSAPWEQLIEVLSRFELYGMNRDSCRDESAGRSAGPAGEAAPV